MKRPVKEEEGLPHATVLQAALRGATQRLASELQAPGAEAPDWREFEWRVAMAVAVMHGVSALLAGRLRWQGPPHWQAFLAAQAAQGRRREQRVRELLARLDAGARSAGLPLLAMKGAALLQLGLYAAGERPMSDVDLLAHPADAAAADAVILGCGYARGIVKRRHAAYEPLHQRSDRAFGEHETHPVKIELHEAVREALPLREIDITAALMATEARPGLNPYRDTAALMRHLLLHAAGNACTRSVRMIQLHDIARLAPHLDARGWERALAPASDGRPAWWAVPPLRLAQALCPGGLPDGAQAPLARAAAACPPGLRHAEFDLTGMSLSHLAIPMLPGLAWSRGPGDVLALGWQRLFPDRQERAATAELLDRQHSLAGSAWTRRPRLRKALSFLFGAPSRAQTLYSVHRALAYRPDSPA